MFGIRIIPQDPVCIEIAALVFLAIQIHFLHDLSMMITKFFKANTFIHAFSLSKYYADCIREIWRKQK